ncbi:hypothetical protein P153DRAFT_401972 [Dothidotthia symphoricarpi CBS 119687]|uniref:BTB domain-containing protein n=1 Tax=Dothidotthia symphoricarpi CBS 119687 TaxID=1392245 RepID=A0A6A5ZYN4_9PLEO|nr:uncharacterized protein P153DRAFT_401972 [Dothidotthia symphoricarpi CBS 119687]KAF2123498.1 hypothetical protein P153DRAFT_401972 [Dothidotthia symphoricarpi CBS 119687]
MAPSTPATANKATTDSGEPPQKVRRLMTAGPSFDSPITVKVGTGEDQETFYVSERLLRNSSVFFENALSKDWKEVAERIVTLPDMEPVHFQTYAKFLSTGLLYVSLSEKLAVISIGDKTVRLPDLDICLKLYKAADFLQDLDFRDALVDALVEIALESRDTEAKKFYLHYTAVGVIYDYTREDSPFRQFAVDIALYSWTPTVYSNRAVKQFPPAFLGELLAAAGPFVRSTESADAMEDPLNLNDPCKYHEHVLLGKPCYKTKYHH